MQETRPAGIDIDALLLAMAPPSVPDVSFNTRDPDLNQLKVWNRPFTVSLLSGLAIDPSYQAYGIRIDWLQRLVLSKSEGHRKPQSAELIRAMNKGLERAGVLRLEDPPEDLFCNLICTPKGNYRIFTGHWEDAGPYTQTLLDAFLKIPSWPTKTNALQPIYALLVLSDALATRADVHRLTSAGGEPKGALTLPTTDALKRIARRARFTGAELSHLRVTLESLAPFILDPGHLPHVSAEPPGNSPLEFHPLLAHLDGVIIASPSAFSLAIRALIVRSAQQVGADKALLSAMLVEQQVYSELSGFWPVRSLELSTPDAYFIRTAVCRFSGGRMLHVIQVPARFDRFPAEGFATTRVLGDQENSFIAEEVSRFWKFIDGLPECRESITVLLLSGWGTPHSIAPPIDEQNAPKTWSFLAIGFAEAAVLGTCQDGKFRDVLRITAQRNRLERDGFIFQNLNGILNFFGWWRSTDGNLIPEHFLGIEPPCHISIPTNELLAPRVEAATKRDLRSLLLPDGSTRLVQRLDWNDDDDFQPIYGSLHELEEGRLLGAVFLGGRTWWIESSPGQEPSREWCYRVWHASLEWLAAVGDAIIEAFPRSFPPVVVKVNIVVAASSSLEGQNLARLPDVPLVATIIGYGATATQPSSVETTPEWTAYLAHPENQAEIELISAILEQIAAHGSSAVSRELLRERIIDAIGSQDWRWLHVRQVITPIDHLAGSGLIGPFREIRRSASSLVRCGSVWGTRKRSDGLTVEGIEACKEFLGKYRDHILDSIVAQIRRFDRKQLIAIAAGSYQSARLEQSHWRGTIRALRAIHGTTADTKAFKRQNAINAVQRAAKSICEIAACEAPETGGLDPDPVDVEELFARALLLFSNGQLFASIRAGLIEPILKLSPAGDLLSDRLVSAVIIRPVAEWSHARALDHAAVAYLRQRSLSQDESEPDKISLDDTFKRAIVAEYGLPLDEFISVHSILVEIAKAQARGIFFIRRSELRHELTKRGVESCNGLEILLTRLTLPRRASWVKLSSGFTDGDIDLTRFDRPLSLVNRPLLAIDDEPDTLMLVAPVVVADAAMYSLSGLREGTLQGHFWTSPEARKYAGMRASVVGREFEDSVADKLRSLGLAVWPRCKLSWALNEKVPAELGDIDVLVVSEDRRRVWVIEVKNLRMCRTEAEVAARFSEYRGLLGRDDSGREKPDKLLRHLRRVRYLRQRRHLLSERVQSVANPEVRALLIVDTPQPMNFHTLGQLEDGQSAFLDTIGNFAF